MQGSGQRAIDVKPARVPRGTLVYQLGAEPCIGTGIEWTADEAESALAGHVSQVLHDVAGSEIVREVFRSLGQTDFEPDAIGSIVEGGPKAPWRVGEAIGEAYLVDWRNCTFPWPMSRDARRRTASLPGPDLIGLMIEGEADYFVFGQIKTSSETSYPPTVMRGTSGLPQQLRELRDDGALHEDLIRYLLFRCAQGPLQERFAAAARRYLASPSGFRLYGVLVRDVAPDDRDLRGAVSWLGRECPAVGQIEVLGLYLPAGRIGSFAAQTAVPVGGAS